MSLIPPRVIAVDFDGVIHSYKHWTGELPTDPPTAGAREALAKWRAAGHRVIVFTCRALTPGGRTGTWAWLKAHGIEVDEVTAVKPHAAVYIDDRAARFRGSWDEMDAIIEDPTPAKATPERATGREHPDAGDIPMAVFDPRCPTCATSVGEGGVAPDGTYAACGHRAPGMEAVS